MFLMTFKSWICCVYFFSAEIGGIIVNESKIFLEKAVDEVYYTIRPNATEYEKIITNFADASKCSSPNHQWTEWGSFTDLSRNTSDGNDYELLEGHRSENSW